MKHLLSTCIIFTFLFFIFSPGRAQHSRERRFNAEYPLSRRIFDSITASRIPELTVPAERLKATLPSSVDNSENDYWPGLLDQYQFYSCQQYSGPAYTFGYEFNRLRNTPGWHWENRFPAHYTWNFFNQGGRYIGVNFLHSFDVIRQQGHMTNDYFGSDTTGSYLGWTTGYDKYFSGMNHRLKQVFAIPVNSASGINTLRNYLYDHLDGSATGGVACFTTDSWFEMGQLPAGTPEAGKSVQLSWHPIPDHGLCIVGYNDSIRYDLNGDGEYTNHIDINADGIVDAKDWEIGGFKFANSWGYWWENEGYAYVLYSAMASDYEAGGVWNNRVYIVKADTGYHPLLTTKVKIDYNKRQRIRIIAGINTDISADFPDHTISFPIFNYQGGDYVMTGNAGASGAESLEFGLDITPLLNWFPENGTARLFVGLEEHDPDYSGSGAIMEASFISYAGVQQEFTATTAAVNILDNDLTLVSAVTTVNIPKVVINTNELPTYISGQPYQVQLEASGGTAPYTWSLHENYAEQHFTDSLPPNTGSPLTKISNLRPYTAMALPFSFPFYGTLRDSIYINFYGFVSFEPDALPAPYITDELAMLRMFPIISPAFSQYYTYIPANNNGVFYHADASSVIIWWSASILAYQGNSNNNFALILYPDGSFEFRYGAMKISKVYTGLSKGDMVNNNIETRWHANTLTNEATRYLPLPNPAGINISPDGLLTVTEADTTAIFEVPVRVTDEENLTGSRLLTLSSGLSITQEVICGEDDRLKFGEQATINLKLQNTGQTVIRNLVISLQSLDTSCFVSNGSVSVATLNPGEPVTLNDRLHFALRNPLPYNYPVRLALHLQSGTRNWNKITDLHVAAAQLEFMQPQIQDGDNNMLDPGEITDLYVTLKNSGNLASPNVALQLESLDPSVQILSDPVQVIDLINPLTRHIKSFRLQVSRLTPQGHTAAMRLTASSDTALNQVLNFELPVGKKAVALINLATSNASMNAMKQALDSLSVSYDTLHSLNIETSGYNSIFLILGQSSTGSHVLNFAEASTLAQYLQTHGNLYMESYFTWHYSNNTVLHPYFKYTTANGPLYYFNNAIGESGTFTDAMSFAYTGNPNFCRFNFEPQTPAYPTFVNTDVPGRNLEIVYPGPDYKTIGTFLEFGSMTGGTEPSSQRTLMQRYLEFFELNITGPYALFHADKTSVCPGSMVNFSDDSFNNIVSWQWEFPGGTPGSGNQANPVVQYNTPGTFDVKLTVSDGSHSRTLVRKNFISIPLCTGQEEQDVPKRLSIFPNPAKGQTIVTWEDSFEGHGKLYLYNYLGQRVREIELDGSIPGHQISLNLSELRSGIFFLQLLTKTYTATGKIVVN